MVNLTNEELWEKVSGCVYAYCRKFGYGDSVATTLWAATFEEFQRRDERIKFLSVTSAHLYITAITERLCKNYLRHKFQFSDN